MKKKTIFDKHLYREGIRSLTPFGSIFLGLLSIFCILFSVSGMLDNSFKDSSLMDLFGSLTTQYTILYFLIIVFVVPILTLRIFSFLTTRNGSDFYHAIPHKKQCIYLSFAAAAVFTWVALCTLIPAVIGYVIFAIAGVHVMSIGMFLLAILHILTAALLVMSAACIACAITGTLLTNIITTGLILFFPRVFLYACRLILANLTNNFILGNSFFLGTRCNLVVQSILGLSDNNYYMFNIAPMIYTLALSVIYLVLAAFLFERRHSELAMKPTLSKKMQAFTCLLVGTAVSLIPIAVLTSVLENGEKIDVTFVFGMFVIYLLIVIGMGVYELLTTKRIRNLIRIIPRTGILAVINLVLILALFGGKKLVYSYTPEASDITSVSFGFSNPNSSELFNGGYFNTLFSLTNDDIIYSYNNDDYFVQKSNAYKTSDETVKKIIAKAMQSAVKKDYEHADNHLLVTITTGSRTITRGIRVSQSDFNTLREAVIKDKNFTSIYTELPEVTANCISVSLNSSATISKEDMKALYETAREEMRSLGEEQWQPLLADMNGYTSIGYLSFAVTMNGAFVESRIPICPSLPKTYQQYINLVNAANKDHLKNFSEKAASIDPKDSYCSLDFSMIDPAHSYSITDSRYMEIDLIKKKEGADFLNALISVENLPVDITNQDCYIVRVATDYSSYSNNEDLYATKYISLDKKTADALVASIDKLNNDEAVEEELYQ